MNYKPIVLTAMFLLFAACSKEGSEKEMAEPKILRLAYVMGTSELIHDSAKRFAELVKTKSEGEMEVRLYSGGQLGNDQQLLEALQLRAVDAVFTGAAPIGWYAPEYGLVEAPFVWRDFDHVQRVWESEIGEGLRATVNRRSRLDLHSLWFRGPRYLTSSGRKVTHPDQLKGMKLRVPELDVYMKSWRTFGANTTPIPFTDLFMALKLGVAEGQENPLATIYGNNLYEVQPYVMETQHLIGFFLLVTGGNWETRFSDIERGILQVAFEEARLSHNQNLAQSEATIREKLIAAGVEFVPVDRQAFQDLAKREIPEQFEGKWKAGLYKQIVNFK